MASVQDSGFKPRPAKSTISPGSRYVDNPNTQNPRILSSGGVSAGIDQAFYMLREIMGNDAVASSTVALMEWNETRNWVYGEDLVRLDWESAQPAN